VTHSRVDEQRIRTPEADEELPLPADFC
jgi:hypothetical protein